MVSLLTHICITQPQLINSKSIYIGAQKVTVITQEHLCHHRGSCIFLIRYRNFLFYWGSFSIYQYITSTMFHPVWVTLLDEVPHEGWIATLNHPFHYVGQEIDTSQQTSCREDGRLHGSVISYIFCSSMTSNHVLSLSYIHRLVQERCNSSASAMELRLLCTNPLIFSLSFIHYFLWLHTWFHDFLWEQNDWMHIDDTIQEYRNVTNFNLLNFQHQWPDQNSWPWVPGGIFLSWIRVSILFKQRAPCFYCLHQIMQIIYYAESAKSHNQNKWGPSSLGQLYNITTPCRDKFIGAIRGEISTVRQQGKTDFVHQGCFNHIMDKLLHLF